jgi:hypothetical protein
MVRFCTQQAFDPTIRDFVETTMATIKSVEENDNGATASSSVRHEFDAPSCEPSAASRDEESPRNGQIPDPSDDQVLGSIWSLPSSDDDRWEDNIDTRKRSSSWKDDEDEKNTAVAPSVKHDWSTDPTMRMMVISNGNGALPREERFTGIFGSANPTPPHHAAYLNSNLAQLYPIEMQTNNRKEKNPPSSNDDDDDGEKIAMAGAVARINGAKRFKQTKVSSGLPSSAVHTAALPSQTPPVFTEHPIPSTLTGMPVADVATLLPPPEDSNAVYFDMMRHGATQKLREVVQRFAIHHLPREDMVHHVRAILRREAGIDRFFLLEHHPLHHHPIRGRSEEQPNIQRRGKYTWRLATEEEILQKIWQLLVNVRCWRETVRRRDLMHQRGREPPFARNIMAQDRRADDPPHLEDCDKPHKADAEEIMGDMDTVRREYQYYDTHYQRMLADASHRWKPQEIETVQQARNIYKKLLDQRERIVVGNLHVGSLDDETNYNSQKDIDNKGRYHDENE